MYQQSLNSCPRCQQDFPQERLNEITLVCPSCGWTKVEVEKAFNKRLNKRITSTYWAIAITAISLFIHSVNWGPESFEVIPLKAGQLVGFNGLEETARLAEICEIHKKWDCVSTALAQLAKDGDNEAYGRLGKLQALRGQSDAALSSYNNYFSAGGLSVDHSYEYAKLLGLSGHVDEASAYYKRVLDSKPETLQVSVTQSYVRLLMQSNRLREAHVLLKKIRQSGANTNLFMNKEFEQIETSLRQ